MSRVLLFSSPLTLRGTSVYTVSLARELKLRGHKIAVMAPGGTLDEALEEQDVTLIRAPIHGSFWRDALYFNVHLRLARDFDPEIVHVQSHPLAAIGALLAEQLGVPDVVTVHTHVRDAVKLPPGAKTRAIAVSEDVRQTLVTQGRFPRDRIRVIPNGVATSLSALGEDAPPPGELPVVGTVSRLARGRGIEHFLQAARLLVDGGAKAAFLVMGEGPQEKELRALARKLDLTKHLTFALPRARLSDLFRPIDVYVSVGESEGHGIFILSAMAEARAVVCTGVGGVVSYVRDGENGVLVQKGDVAGLAQRIDALLRAPEERRRLGRNALHDVREQFSLHPMVEETAAVYDEALGLVKKVPGDAALPAP